MKKFLAITLILVFSSFGFAQSIVVSAQPDLAEWDIIYLTDFDFENGQNNPLIFGYRLSASDDTYPVEDVTISLMMTANVPSLGLSNELLLGQSDKLLIGLGANVLLIFLILAVAWFIFSRQEL